MSSDEYLGCSDGGCIFGHPGGLHTNGGCHCVPSLSTFHTMTANERLELRNKIRKCAAQNKLLREQLRQYASHLSGCLWEARQPDGGKICDCGLIELLHPGDPRAARR